MTPSTLQADLPCVTCGYNLRGLPDDGNCPECGSAIAASLSSDLLRYSGGGWRKIVAQGVANLWVYDALGLGYSILAAAYYWPDAVVPGRALIGKVLSSGVYFLILVVADWLAAWNIATPEPLMPLRRLPRRINHRSSLRFIATTYVIIIWIAHRQPVLPRQDYADWHIASNLVGMLYVFFVFGYIQELCRRIPDQGLREQARWMMWARLFVLACYAYAWMLVSQRAQRPWINTANNLLACTTCLWGILLLWPRLRRAILTA